MSLTKDQLVHIKAFIDNKPMLDAVCSVLLPDEEIAFGVDISKDDEEYGRAVKAWVGARTLIKERLAQLARLASSNPQPAPQNEAR